MKTVTVLYRGTGDKDKCVCWDVDTQITHMTNRPSPGCNWCGSPMNIKEILCCIDDNKVIKGLSQDEMLAFWKTLPDVSQ